MEKDPKTPQKQEKEVVFTDNSHKDYFIRTISEDVDEMSLIWHKDQYTRDIEVIESDNWQFQFDNKVPFKLENNQKFTILRECIHRVIKGSGDLILKIKEHK